METAGLRSRMTSSMEAPNGVDKRPLMAKLREHYYNRDFTPKGQEANRWGSTFSCGFLFWLCFIHWWYLLPWFHVAPTEGDSSTHEGSTLCHSFWVWFLYFETNLNWILAARKQCNHVTLKRIQKALPGYDGGTPEGWSHCIQCQMPAPKRSHHCKICQHCILLRDHHCFFTGTCVGFWNQRHFIVWLWYVCLVGSTTCVYMVPYLDHLTPILTYQGAYDYCLPVAMIRWLGGNYSTFTLITLINLHLVLICVFSAAGFLCWEVLIVLRGQTSYEFLHNLTPCKYPGVVQCLRNVFGPYWFVNFVWPLPVAQDGNGMTWDLREDPKYR